MIDVCKNIWLFSALISCQQQNPCQSHARTRFIDSWNNHFSKKINMYHTQVLHNQTTQEILHITTTCKVNVLLLLLLCPLVIQISVVTPKSVKNAPSKHYAIKLKMFFQNVTACTYLSLIPREAHTGVHIPYSWIADQLHTHTHTKLICRQTRGAATLLRPPLESSRRGESKSAVSIFVQALF